MKDDIEIICKYKYLSTEYLISIINKEELLFSKIDEGRIENKLSLDELYIATQVLDSLTINKDCSVFIRKIKVGENIYKLYFDKKTRLYWWINESGRISKDDNLYLNKKYNEMKKVLYVSDYTEENTDNIERRIFIKNTLIAILCSSMIGCATAFGGLCISNKILEYKVAREIIEYLDDPSIKTYRDLKELIKNREQDYEEEYREEIEKDNEYSWEKIKNAIESNENLTRRRKRISV